MLNMKRAGMAVILAVALLSISAATVIAGESGKIKPSARNLTLQVNAAASIYADMFNKLARTFEAQNPGIRISMDTTARSQSVAFQKTLRLAVVDDLPDVSFQGPNHLRYLKNNGYIQALDTWINADPEWTKDRFSPSVTQSTKIGGQTMGLGVGFSFPIIYYNVELVKEARNGVPTLPGDWKGILSLAEKIKGLHPDILGIYARFQSFYSQGLIRSLGGRLGNESGTMATLSEPGTLAGIRIFQQIGALGQAENAMTGDQARQAFSAGKTAIHLDSSSSLRRFLKQSKGRFELGTAPLPLGENGELSTSGFAIVMHTKDPRQKSAAWRFMKFVAGPEGQAILGSETGFVPGNEIPVETPDLLGDYYAAIPQIKAVLDSIPYAGPWYLFKGPNNKRIGSLFDTYMERVVMQEITPENAALKLTRDINALIE